VIGRTAEPPIISVLHPSNHLEPQPRTKDDDEEEYEEGDGTMTMTMTRR
jgi:hypothetical protein